MCMVCMVTDVCVCIFRDWSLNMGRGGLQNGKIAGWKHYAFSPLPQDRVKLFVPPLFLKGGIFCHPPSVWLKLQATT